MKKNLFFIPLLNLVLIGTNLLGQNWTKHGIGLSAANVCVVDISAPSDNVAWSIMSVFSAGSCGAPVPYFSKTINGNSFSSALISISGGRTPMSICALNSVTAWVAVCDINSYTNGSVYKTTNGGASWSLQASSFINDAARFVHFFNANDGLLIGDSSVMITNDGGTNWSYQTSIPVPWGAGATFFLLNAIEVVGDYVYIADTYGNFYKSIDRGLTWTRLPNSIYPSGIKGIAFRDSLNGIAVASYFSGGGSGGGGYVDNTVSTSDGGLTWQPVYFNFNSTNCSSLSAKYDVAYVPGTYNTYVVTSEYDASFAAFSTITTDGGLNWQLLDSTEQHTACIFTSPTNGYSGGYLPNFASGMFKWTGNLTGIKNLEKSNEVITYPNPALNSININIENSSLKEATVRLTDLSGRAVLIVENVINHNGILNVSINNLKTGFYLISISNGDSILFNSKIFKM